MRQDEIQFFLVDDDKDDHEFFKYALRKIDPKINCATANNGVEALELMGANESFVPDFIFLDINMPKMNGKECLVHLMKIEKLSLVPIYMYTTSSSEADKTETLQAGATGFITKPASIGLLQKILTEIIDPLRWPQGVYNKA